MINSAEQSKYDPLLLKAVLNRNDKQIEHVVSKVRTILGGSLKDVIRTRVFIKNLSDWKLIAKIHGERFKNIMPTNTLVQVAGLIGDDYLVEIEAEAVIK